MVHMTNDTDTAGIPEHIEPARYTEAELALIRAEVAHEDEIEALREAEQWDSDYTVDPSGQS